MTGVPYTFSAATAPIPLSQLDANFNTTLTIGSTSVGLGNTVTTVSGLTLSSPTLSGTVGGALTFSGALTLSSALTYGGVTLSNSVTGTGSMVLSASPTFTGTVYASGIAVTAGNALNYQFGAYATSSTKAGYQAGNSNTGFNSTNGAFFGVDTTGNTMIDGSSSFPILFKLSGTEKARIDTSGRNCINTTTYINNSDEKLTVLGTACVSSNGLAAGILAVQTTNTSYYSSYAAITPGTTALICRWLLGVPGSNYDIGSISYNGTNVLYNGTSDERLKNWDGIEQVNYRDRIKALWLGDFDKYTTFEKTGTPHRTFGIRAQQAYAVLGHAAAIKKPEDGASEWQAPSEPYAFLALWGVKDLYAENEALKARITALENK